MRIKSIILLGLLLVSFSLFAQKSGSCSSQGMGRAAFWSVDSVKCPDAARAVKGYPNFDAKRVDGTLSWVSNKDGGPCSAKLAFTGCNCNIDGQKPGSICPFFYSEK